MKKIIKRMGALALCVLMVLSMIGTAWAAGDDAAGLEPSYTGTIYINNAQPGATYHAYKLLDLYALNSLEGAEGEQLQIYGLKNDSPWLGFFLQDANGGETGSGEGTESDGVSNAPGAAWFDVQPVENGTYEIGNGESWAIDYVVSLKSTLPEGVTADSVGGLIAQAALKWVADHSGIEAAGTLESASGLVVLDGENPDKITVTEPGYYLVDTNSGSLGSLGTIGGATGETTVTTELHVDEKNTVPMLSKTVWNGDSEPAGNQWFENQGVLSLLRGLNTAGGSTGSNESENVVKSWTGTTSVNFGDTVHYRLSISPSKGMERYWIFDLMDPSLELDTDSFTVWKYTFEITEENPTNDGSGDKVEIDASQWAVDTEAKEYVEEVPVSGGTMTYSHKCSFIVKFADELVRSLGPNDYLMVFYDATLKTNAVASANVNSAVLGTGVGSLQYTDIGGFSLNETILAEELGDGATVPSPSDPSAKPTGDGVAQLSGLRRAGVYSHYFDLVKTDKDDTVLAGATFQLLDAIGEPIALVEYEEPAGFDPVGRALADYQGTYLHSVSVKIENEMSGDLITGESSSRMVVTGNINATNALERPWRYKALTHYEVPGETEDADPITWDCQERDHYYRPALEGETGVTEFEAGHIRFVGLDEGIYSLHEIAAPEGYNKLAQDQKIELKSGARNVDMAGEMLAQANTPRSRAQIGGLNPGQIGYGVKVNGTAALYINGSETPVSNRGDVVLEGTDPAVKKYAEKVMEYAYESAIRPASELRGLSIAKPKLVLSEIDNGGVQIVNLTGTELPHTGGMGTTLFYIVGGLLVAGAGILLVVKKRMSHESDEG